MSNRLSDATSPYLLQHAQNPVEWWEWGEDAFDEARRRGVPIFLSIGYSACHWCHVMAHESFEDETIAAHVNENFVAIKVDREERPDIDAVYMDATVAMTGHGGWPMTVFLDHDARPFFAGTYFPPAPRHQMPSFPQVLQAIVDTWTTRRTEVEESSQRIVEVLSKRQWDVGDSAVPTLEQLDAAVSSLLNDFDDSHGGFGPAPKFPPSMVLEFLIGYQALPGAAHGESAHRMVERTLTAMARGGMYDQLGGGFARYSVDEQWTVPHFEKMLYDNALLLRVYLHWWRLAGSSLAERVVRETAEFLLRDLRTPEGGFASALDADSEGVEGKFYAWTPRQLVDCLGETDGAWAAQVLSVTDTGTFEHGTSTLQLLDDPDDLARWESVRERLWRGRENRVHPGRDDKIVAAWNGMAIAALAEAGQLLDEPSWVEAATGAGDLLIAVHLGAAGDDRLCRTSRAGRPGSNLGVLSDYAGVAEGLLVLH
ncbi:MAG: thioredoxin domain-containing protein, partial [Actinomycetia bacterium]|nr:thioredoxin domain-containing protein [Actinomycetes bacterium]